MVPLSASSFSEAIEVAWNVRAATARVLEDGGHSVALIADEGGLGPVMPTNRAALEAVSRGIERAGYALGEDVGIAIDIAATQFYSPPERGDYRLAAEDRDISAAGLISELQEWAGSFPIVSMEDVLAEDDWEAGCSLPKPSRESSCSATTFSAPTSSALLREFSWVPRMLSWLSRIRSAPSRMRARWLISLIPPAWLRFSRRVPERRRTVGSRTWRWGWGTGQIKVGSTMSPSGRASGTVFWRSRRGFVMVRITPVAMLLRPTPTRLHVLDGSTLQTFCEAMGETFQSHDN